MPAGGAAPILEIVFYVDDPERDAAFLVAAAGLAIGERKPDYLVLLHPSGLRLALRPYRLAATTAGGAPSAPPPPPPGELVLGAGDVSAAHARALAAGAASLLAPARFAWGEVATVRAPGGTRITWFRR